MNVDRRTSMGLALGAAIGMAGLGSQARAQRRGLVTSLADVGPGSLRSALEAGPGTVVTFAVGGTIHLEDNLVVAHPDTVIDGASGPAPGITLVGASLRVRASGTHVAHLRIRPGNGPGPNLDARDGITIDGADPVSDVLVENCSISWATDEGLAIAAGGHRRIILRRNLIAEQLNESGHTKGAHSRGMLIATGSRNILVEQNLFAHNYARNPVVAGGSSAAVLNNLIYNFGSQSIHFYQKGEPIEVVVVGNVLVLGPDSLRKGVSTFGPQIAENGIVSALVTDNLVVDGDAVVAAPEWSNGSPALGTLGEPLPAADVEQMLPSTVGARPFDRDRTDLRIVREVALREGRIRDTPPDV